MAGTFLRAHTCGPIVVGGSSAFNLDGVDPQSLDPGTELIKQVAAGDYQPTYAATMNVAPRIRATITDIKTALDAGIWLTGFAIPLSTTYTTVDLYFTKIAASGTRSGASSNVRCRITNGMIIPRTLSVEQSGTAKLSIDIIPIWDGSTAPVVFTDSVSIPHTPSIDELYTLGQCAINGSVLDSLQGFTLDFGIKEEALRQSGEFYFSRVHILQVMPTITLTNKDIVQMNAFTPLGTAQGSTDSLCYLQKMAENGTRVAAGTAEHIQFSIDDGMIRVGDTGGANDASHGSSVVIEPTYDGTNAIIVKNTAVAIS